MSLFQCEKCGCVENTATSNYWFRKDKTSACKGQKLCSACDPDLNKWHGVFKRMYLPKGQFHTNQQGNLTHTESGKDDCSSFMLEQEEGQ